MTITLNKPQSLHLPTITTLPENNLTIIAEQIPVAAVTLNIWFNMGSAVEADNINGMAHFLEHMIFKGSRKLGLGEFERLLEARGAMTNAATSQEYTHFYFTCAPQDFVDILPLQLDLVSNPSLPPEEFTREKKVVLEEIRRSHDNPRRRVFDKMMNLCFPNLPYHRPILGTEEIIENLKLEQMQSFHHSWYQPSGMTIVAVGNLPVEELTENILNTLSLKSNQLQPPSPEYSPELPFTDIITEEYTDSNLQQARLMMLWRVPGLNHLEETIALDVLAVILGRGKLSRLFRDLRENRRLVTRISASNTTYKIQGGFYVSAQLSQENIEIVQAEIIKHIQEIQQFGVTEAELNRVKQNVASQFIFQSEKPSDRTNLYGYYYSQLRTITPALEYSEKVKHITVEKIQETAIKYLSLDAYGVLIARN
ncbi:pitrilysin family protein [Cyanobacterium aponinum UTEX 3221]|uniref:M16 family metallopeptidase n=1 Tax=Cyanobacterium aponinum TaxID=379064 RepID=UPI0016818ED6|nr:pitrilysin family protein [Cyanobacterium aponinum]MBD2395508.1 insulinase family protein [Cyanobacterium aponinum FACHB-4101]WRL37472.1 pitrilysin family protein [Cyanobacterium aponinum UTEX 3221]